MTRDDYFIKWARGELTVGDLCDMLAERDAEIELLQHETTTMYYGGYREGYDKCKADNELDAS